MYGLKNEIKMTCAVFLCLYAVFYWCLSGWTFSYSAMLLRLTQSGHPLFVGKMSTGDDNGHRHGRSSKFLHNNRLLPGLLVH